MTGAQEASARGMSDPGEAALSGDVRLGASLRPLLSIQAAFADRRLVERAFSSASASREHQCVADPDAPKNFASGRTSFYRGKLREHAGLAPG